MEFQPNKENCSFSVITSKLGMELEEDKQDSTAALILFSLTYVEVDQETAEVMEKERNEAIHEALKQLWPWIPPVPSVTHLMEKCSQVISKQLECSDVKDNQARLALKKDYVLEEFVPMLNSNENITVGIDVVAYDSYGNSYNNMRFVVWGSKMYVFTKQWKQFCEDYKLISGNDGVSVWMFRDKYTGRLCAVIIPILDQSVSIATRISIRHALNAKNK